MLRTQPNTWRLWTSSLNHKIRDLKGMSTKQIRSDPKSHRPHIEGPSER